MLVLLWTAWKKKSNVTYLDDVSSNPLNENNVPVNSVNVNVTNNGVPINQRINLVNKDKDGTDELLEDCSNSSKSTEDD